MNGITIFVIDVFFVATVWFCADFKIGMMALAYCGLMGCVRYKYNRFVINTIMGLKEEIKRLGGVV